MNILIPDSWLREYLETDATPQQLKDCLSLCGPSVERINKVNSDYVYDIEITSNRVDMASVYGIAREAAAILPRFGLKASLKTPEGWMTENDKDTPGVEESKTLPMEVSDPNKICNRIMGVVMEVNPMKDSPDYVKERLEKSGVRSLNNLVDITNYVMLEVGHPCHVFDYDRIKTHKFLLRFAKKNEQIITLDGKKYLLNSEDVIIDDGSGRVIDLPGIMGTENSVVTYSTRRIFFFIESNNPLFIRKTSMRYGIRTMAAAINEKHPDPNLVKIAMLRGIELYQKIAGGKVAGELIDIYPNPPKPAQIKVSINFINERLGIELKKAEIISILESLSFQISDQDTSGVILSEAKGSPDGGGITITPPSFRQFDVTIPEDIVEEVARIYGYHNLPSRLMTGEIPITAKPKILGLEEEAKRILKYWGHTEIYNYSFISEELIKKSGLKISEHLKLANPLTEEIVYMRISLIPSMLETVANNQPYSGNLQLFELAKVYIPPRGWPAGVATQARTPPMVSELPNEISMLTITNQKDFYQLKGTVEALLNELGVDYSSNEVRSSQVVRTIDPNFLHPQQSLTMINNGKIIASLGKIHPSIAQNFQIKNDLYIAVLNIELLAQFANPSKKYVPIPMYPKVVEDITIQYPEQTYLASIISEIYRVSNLIRNVYLLDRYKNAVTLRITYQHEKRNITNEEVKTIRSNVLQHLGEKFKARLKE